MYILTTGIWGRAGRNDMATDLTIRSIAGPMVGNSFLPIIGKTFIGIDFGTSTTVVSIAYIQDGYIKTRALPLKQIFPDGATGTSERIPTILAWYRGTLYVGAGAESMKYDLVKDKNVWYSFKMHLGEDIGAQYYKSELANFGAEKILTPKDAATVFFKYLKIVIEDYIQSNSLPEHVEYAVSVPASFEANQRSDLMEALSASGINLAKQSFIDEPNAAFLSYVANSGEEGVRLAIPDNYNPRVLVFDYGAGTCDISILELSKDHHGISSKNIAISRFEKCGGDDVDRFIAAHYLWPQILEQNGVSERDFRSREKRNLVKHLMKPAELLKLEICKKVSLQMRNGILPAIAYSDEIVRLNMTVKIDSSVKYLTLDNPTLSFEEFNEAMKSFLLHDTCSLVQKDGDDDIVSVFSPVESAISKARISNHDIDYVLLIGGSSYNPYVQFALQEYFKDSKLLIPIDLQTHVSQGAAIHSLFLNALGVNIINPITSERIFVITKDGERTLLSAGQQIPCERIVIDDLITSAPSQVKIELPICVGSRDKILQNLIIMSGDGRPFKIGTRVTVEVSVTVDKLLHLIAYADGKAVSVEPLNPFANKPLTADERIVLKAQREANDDAARHNGKPSIQCMRALAAAYKKTDNDLQYAETLEEINILYPGSISDNTIGVAYGNAGNEEKALKYFEQDYLKHPNNPTSIFNYANEIKYKEPNKYEQLMKKSLEIDSDNPVHLFDYGRWERRHGKEAGGMKKIQQAMEIWNRRFVENTMFEWDYSWYSSAARELGDYELADKIEAVWDKNQNRSDSLYDENNLTVRLI